MTENNHHDSAALDKLTEPFTVLPNDNPASDAKRQELIDKPAFGQVFSDNMAHMSWTKGEGWGDRRIEPLPNLQLLRVDGEALTEYFAENEVDLIYLNFSDPWPKKKHEKRRLTYKNFLATDEIILKPNGEIHFKTDNQGLFEYSLSSFSKYGMIIERVWLDLHNSEFEGNIMTEYEEKFSSRGQRIYRVEARFVAK